MDIVEKVLMFIAGLGVFLIGIGAMGGNIEAVAGSNLRKLFNKISNNRFIGIGVGASVTAVIQSSSATTVMVVGFVNTGMMTLMQAAPIIMGANIGTTVTGLMVSLQSLPVTTFLACMACVGAFMAMSKKDVMKKVGAILASLGMVFVGLEVMSSSMSFFREMQSLQDFMASLTNPFLLVLIGMVFTALIQSSSAMTGILIVMAGNQLITITSCIYMVLGINIGTCITTMLASIGTNTNAKRAAAIHLLFNVAGALLFFIIEYTLHIEKLLVRLTPDPQWQLSIFHLFFNIITTLLLLPFVKHMVKLVTLIVPEKKAKGEEIEIFVENKLKYLDDRILETPAIAVSQLQKEILLMAEIAKKNLDLSIDSITRVTLEKLPKFEARERQLNFMNREITKYLVKLSALELSHRDELKISSYYHVISDIERIGDYAENVMEYTAGLVNDKIDFTEDAKAEIKEMHENISKVYENVIKVFVNKDLSLLPVVSQYEDNVDECKRVLAIHHIERLNKNICSAEAGALFLNLISNLERISDHLTNIATSIKDYARTPQKISAQVKKKEKNGELHKYVRESTVSSGQNDVNVVQVQPSDKSEEEKN